MDKDWVALQELNLCCSYPETAEISLLLVLLLLFVVLIMVMIIVAVIRIVHLLLASQISILLYFALTATQKIDTQVHTEKSQVP